MAHFLQLLMLLFLVPGLPAGELPEPIQTAKELRQLTVQLAQQNLPVHLRGVVTFFDESLYSRFLQDETAGIYLQYSSNSPPLEPGQIIEVTGRTSPGEYAPILVPERIKVLGEAILPQAKPVTYEELATGKEDSQFVEISGVVRCVQKSESSSYYIIEVASGGGRFPVYIRDLPVGQTEDLPDSTIRVRGVISTEFNHQRQLFALRLLAPRAEDLMIETAAPKDPFAAKARSLGSLLQFDPQESFGHRIRVSGTVVYYEPGKRVFLQAGEQGLEVQTKGREPLELGDRVEAVGFVSQGDYTPLLQDALCRKIASGPTLGPELVTPAQALKGNHDCSLIRVTAKLFDRAVHGPERDLILQDGEIIFHAYLRQTNGLFIFADLENGSQIEVTGICKIVPGEWRAGEDWRAKSFRVEMRSAADVVLVKTPPWLTFRKVLWIAAGLAFVTVAAISWVVVLRRQVAERTRELEIQIVERQRAQRERMIEQERTRVAQDLHDELGATLTEVGMLGSLASNPSLPPEAREGYLDKLANASRAVVVTLDEIVWAVNPKYDSVGSLASYYSLFAQRLLNLAGIGCRLEVAESFPVMPLDSRVRHGVFLAFKEALNNAVRHSAATQVSIMMEVIQEQLKISVADNGNGFTLGDEKPGCDGLASMRQRMQKLGGQCEIRTHRGKGTTIEFRLPLKGNEP